MKTMMNGQRGISFSGFLLGVVVLIVAAIIGMKLIPAYMENASIKGALTAVAQDPDMKNAPDSGIRIAYGKRAQVANITAVRPDDVVIDRGDSGLTLSAAYSVKVPLVANVSLLVEFSPSSR